MSDYKIIKEIGEIGDNKHLKIVKWYDNEPKYDLRKWYNNGRVSKGITMSLDELTQLKDILEIIINE